MTESGNVNNITDDDNFNIHNRDLEGGEFVDGSNNLVVMGGLEWKKRVIKANDSIWFLETKCWDLIIKIIEINVNSTTMS